MSVRNFREGLRLVPVSADPTSPEEGQLQYADGTVRPEGVYVFSNGSWEPVGGSTTSTDPNEVVLINSTFDGDLLGWTFTPDVDSTSTGGTSTSTATVDSTNPITGAGSASVNINSAFYPANVFRTNTFEANFTLAGTLQEQSEKVQIELDLSHEVVVGSNIFHEVILKVIETNTTTEVLSQSLLNVGEAGATSVAGVYDVSHIKVQFDRTSTETDYTLVIEIRELDNF